MARRASTRATLGPQRLDASLKAPAGRTISTCIQLHGLDSSTILFGKLGYKTRPRQLDHPGGRLRLKVLDEMVKAGQDPPHRAIQRNALGCQAGFLPPWPKAALAGGIASIQNPNKLLKPQLCRSVWRRCPCVSRLACWAYSPLAFWHIDRPNT